jgi:uncharacterized membrane protein
MWIWIVIGLLAFALLLAVVLLVSPPPTNR